MSEYGEFIDDLMRQYDNSNEEERREMFEDLLLFCCDRAEEAELDCEDERESSFWTGLVIGGVLF